MLDKIADQPLFDIPCLIGGIGPYLLMWFFLRFVVMKRAWDGLKKVYWITPYAVGWTFFWAYPTAWLLGAGYVCVSSGGESGMCGVGGYDGGVAMLAIGGLMAMGLAYIRARPPS